jgi:hypothetical protein
MDAYSNIALDGSFVLLITTNLFMAFYDAVSSSDCVGLNGRMHSE